MNILPFVNENEPSEYFEVGGNILPSKLGDSAWFSNSEDDSTFLSGNSINRDECTLQTDTSSKISREDFSVGSGSEGHGSIEEDEKSVRTRLSCGSKSMRISDTSVEMEKKRVILDPSSKRAKEKKIAEFKSERLKITSLKLHGRETEVQTLQECLTTVHASVNPDTSQEVGKNNYSRSLILLKGYSGTGKTALAKSILHQVEAKYNGLFVSGKYDLYLRDEPYFGIIAACREICGAILMLRSVDYDSTNSVIQTQSSEKKQRSFANIKTDLIHKLGVDIHLLIGLIPELEEVVTYTDLANHGLEQQNEDQTGNQLENQAKLHYIFRIFIQTISSYFGPLVMVLDDLQWADVGSLDLIEVIMTDRENSNFMMIGLYRSNEVDATHMLTKKISNLKKANRKDETFNIQEIEVDNLNLEAVYSVTTDLLSLDDTSETKELVSLFHNRTQGNVFFLISFIAMLEKEQLLDYNLNLYRYTWDIEKIKEATGASANVIDLMKNKMSKLLAAHCKLLSVAACLGASFDLEKLEVVWIHFHQENSSNSLIPVEDMISTVIEEGLVERKGGWKRFRFIHDKVQEAAYALIHPDELSAFQVRVGNILRNQMSEDELDSSLFLVMNLLNESTPESITVTNQRVSLAELNYKAAEKSISFSAFSSAARYSQKGIDFLPKNSWSSHYRLTLELYSYAAEAAMFLGNEQGMRHYCNTILGRRDVPDTDKFRANLVLTSFLMGRYREPEAITVLLDVLKKFGFRFPKREPNITLSVIKNLLIVKSIVKKYTLEKAHEVPMMTDARQIQVMRYLDKLSVSTYLCGDPICPIAILRSAIVTDQYGLCDTTPVVFTTVGLLFVATGDFKGADALGDYALVLLSRLSRNAVARTKFSVGCFVYGWTRPYSQVMNVLLEAYQSGMSTGDIESAMFAITIYNLLQYVSGRRLNIVLDDCKAYANQAREQKRDVVVDYLSSPAQMALNLIGHSVNTTVLEGDVIPDVNEFWERSKGNSSCSGFFWVCNQRVCLVFEDFEKGADLFVTHRDFWPEKLPALCLFQDYVFTGGMCCFEMVKLKAKNRQYKQYANKAYALIKEWCKKGCPNVQHYLPFFAAQRAILQKKYAKAESYFQEAISASAKSGFVQNAALASELYGQFLLSKLGDHQSAMFQLERAIGFYAEWGATQKVEMLRDKYGIMEGNEAHLNIRISVVPVATVGKT